MFFNEISKRYKFDYSGFDLYFKNRTTGEEVFIEDLADKPYCAILLEALNEMEQMRFDIGDMLVRYPDVDVKAKLEERLNKIVTKVCAAIKKECTVEAPLN